MPRSTEGLRNTYGYHTSWLESLLEVLGEKKLRKHTRDEWQVCPEGCSGTEVEGNPFAFDPDSLVLPSHLVVFPQTCPRDLGHGCGFEGRSTSELAAGECGLSSGKS